MNTHIAWSATSFLGILWLHYSSYPKISKPWISLLVEHNIFWFDVPMNDTIPVYVLKREKHRCKQELLNNAHKLILVCYSEKRRCLPIWNRKSPPVSRSITRQRLSRSWKAKCIFAMKGCFSYESRTRSFITEFTDFLARTLLL